ncbi:hypothetical protein B0X71_01365 [Planococcus lenghuensis]|uniref:LrgB family protein n=2 Tax=Planococcus lenghuensis TaxID=2213202 RepID=A0A1Q2L3A4_9BACL|nr:hypothetical protein B0X71_01365 [Planococcus lenghuensis]
MLIAIASLIGTILIYLACSRLYMKIPLPILHPVLSSVAVLVLLLIGLDVPYETYMAGARWIDALLGPAVVALAYPLYTQRKLLVRYWKSVLSAVFASLLAGLGSIYVFAVFAGIEQQVLMSLFPKSITTPVAIQVSATLEGIPSMTVAFVMTAGFTGAIIGPAVLQVARVRSEASKGLALGSASHGVGLTKAAELGDRPLSMGSVAMTLSAIFGAGVIPFIIYLFTAS